MNPGKCSEAIRAFVLTNPGCTRDQLQASVGWSRAVFGMAFRTMRRRKLIVVTDGLVSLGRPPVQPKRMPTEEARLRRLAQNRAAKMARRRARGIPPRKKGRSPPKPRARKPRPLKAPPMSEPKQLHPIQAANEAAWALAAEKREVPRQARVETYAEFVARGGKTIVLPAMQYVAPVAMPMRQSFRGTGSPG